MLYEAIINEASTQHNVSPKIVMALIRVESNFQTFAWNPEPRYRYLWNVATRAPFRPLTDAERSSELPPHDFRTLSGDVDQEWWGQQASWGLMQVMGAVAREEGFLGAYLPELCDPRANVQVGCKHLGKLMAWAKGDVVRALAAYNGGKAGNSVPPYRNHGYANKVMRVYETL